MKIVVLFFCVAIVQCNRNRYCEICQNHTLCKYSLGGPTAACRDFDKKASLSDSDVAEIVNKINEKRNLVAVGRLKKFPQAANMRKVQWSTELASFAQRWADQCHPSVRPNKEDECRDLVRMEVGQNIGAVVGPAPGLNVKSFIDMWFTLKLHYTGSVVYYNRSHDEKTNYFTQLIWADTEYVGCGKMKFFNQEINTVIERLVCNFAPKGNNHGKPVYAVGFPATQCPKFMKPDSRFLGLCKQDHEIATDIVPESTVSSLLRILDSSNSSFKQELNPNNLRQISSNRSDIKDQIKQKIRHVYLNNSNGAIKRDSFHMQNSHLNPLNEVDNFKAHSFTLERGHSRMYHGHQTKIEPVQNFQTTPSFSEPDFRRFDVTTTSDPLSIQHNHEYAPNGRRIINSQNEYVLDGRRIVNNNQNDYAPDGRRIINDHNDYLLDARRNYGDHMCTRKPKCNDCIPKPCIANQCTRGQSHSCNSCLKPEPCNSCLPPPPPLPLPPPLPPPLPLPLPLPLPNHDLCPCKANCLPMPAPACPVCPSHNCGPSEATVFCAKRRAYGDAQDANKSTPYNYYDLFPNIGLRSGNENQQKHLENSDIEDSLQYKAKGSEIKEQVTKPANNLRKNFQRFQDSHDIFYSSDRKRRDLEDQMTFKPFWQMDEYNYKRPSDLKSLRYTTLPDKRNKKSRWSRPSIKQPTESITIKLDDELSHNSPHRGDITEKYLSFEELMHLRKLSTLEAIDYEVRRFGDAALRQTKSTTTTKSSNVQTVAANTSDKSKPKEVPTTASSKSILRVGEDTKKNNGADTKKGNGADTKADNGKDTKKEDDEEISESDSDDESKKIPQYTLNPPFIKMEHCTKKITCTWTPLVFLTGPDGKPIAGLPNGAGGGNMYDHEAGSRTPPGYVEGCTRTSTCTRDYMNRNKITTTSGTADDSLDDSYGPHGSHDPENRDEDYCERRSLNVQRRNLDNTDTILSLESQNALTDTLSLTTEINRITNRGIVDDTNAPQSKDSDCICYSDSGRIKRDKISRYQQLVNKGCDYMTESKNTKSYKDQVHSMLKKLSIPKSARTPHRCVCSKTKSIYDTNLFYFSILLLYHML